MRECPRLLVLDPIHEWDDTCVAVTDWDTVLDDIVKPRFRIAVQIEEDYPEQLIKACELVMSEDVGNCVLCIDEVPLYFRNKSEPPQEFVEAVTHGRHKNVSLVLIAQRPIAFPILMRSQASTIYAFRTNEPRDVVWLRDFAGDNALRAKYLKGHAYVRLDDDDLTDDPAGVHDDS